MNLNWTIILTIAQVFSAIGLIFSSIKNAKKTSKDGIDNYINNAIAPSLKDIKKSINDVQKEIKEIKSSSDEKEMQRLRYECLCFASDVRKGISKTRQEYEEIFRMEDSYNKLIEKYKIENGYMHEEMLYVHKQYRAILNNI